MDECILKSTPLQNNLLIHNIYVIVKDRWGMVYQKLCANHKVLDYQGESAVVMNR